MSANLAIGIATGMAVSNAMHSVPSTTSSSHVPIPPGVGQALGISFLWCVILCIGIASIRKLRGKQEWDGWLTVVGLLGFGGGCMLWLVLMVVAGAVAFAIG